MKSNVELGVVPTENQKSYKIVTDPAISRKLLKDGYRIADIKPKHGAPRESIFVFEVTDGLLDKINQYYHEKYTTHADH